MAIALQRPNDARARPSSLLKRDTDYDTVFNRAYPIPLYLACVNLMKLVDREMRAEKYNLDRKDQTNIRFYAATYLACLATRKAMPSPAEIAATSFSAITEDILGEALADVSRIYIDLGSTDQVAKGTELLALLKAKINVRFPAGVATA